MKNIPNNYLTAINAAILGGREILKIIESGDFNTQIKSDNSPVTLADKNSSKKIIIELSKTGIPILSEEVLPPPFKVREKWTKLWIVDPLDGTKEFIKRTNNFCVNIGLVENCNPTFGVIYIPITNTIYFGGKEHGSFKMKIETEILLKTDIEKAIKLPLINKEKEAEQIITGGKHYLDSKSLAILNYYKINFSETNYIALPSAIKFCEIAEGNSDIYPRLYPCMEWDTASGHAILNGIGKNIYELSTNLPLKYNKSDLYTPFFIAK